MYLNKICYDFVQVRGHLHPDPPTPWTNIYSTDGVFFLFQRNESNSLFQQEIMEKKDSLASGNIPHTSVVDAT